ncbi:MAG: hypothetical protein COB53_02695 [Elusimicrobia bacterium]|nr:MAG: hypothetical protein COB53_02695 [Elusimicrobiota bacterium]
MLRLALLLLAVPAAAEEFSVVSWNIHKGKHLARVEKELTSSSLSKASLFALQEVLTDQLSGVSHAAGRDAIISRWKLKKRGHVLVNPETGRVAAWADAVSPDGTTIRIYSLHLSYKIGRNPFIPHVRTAEMRAVLDHADPVDGPIIVAGDFNTVGWFFCCNRSAPLLHLLHKRGYTDALAASNVDCNTQHIVGTVDWIFVKGLTPISATCGNYAGSDHKWIQATLKGAVR